MTCIIIIINDANNDDNKNKYSYNNKKYSKKFIKINFTIELK